MKQSINIKKMILTLVIGLLTLSCTLGATVMSKPNKQKTTASAIFAGGCFWCVEADFDKLKGVTKTVSGYSGGHTKNPTYKEVSYTETGHLEVVKVTYNPTIVSFTQLVDYFLRHVDPTDPHGQFCDKGSSYKTAVFVANDQERGAVEKSLNNLAKTYGLSTPLATKVLPRATFYKAEDYHQNYYKKNPWRYKYYRKSCGRDRKIKQLYGR